MRRFASNPQLHKSKSTVSLAGRDQESDEFSAPETRSSSSHIQNYLFPNSDYSILKDSYTEKGFRNTINVKIPRHNIDATIGNPAEGQSVENSPDDSIISQELFFDCRALERLQLELRSLKDSLVEVKLVIKPLELNYPQGILSKLQRENQAYEREGKTLRQFQFKILAGALELKEDIIDIEENVKELIAEAWEFRSGMADALGSSILSRIENCITESLCRQEDQIRQLQSSNNQLKTENQHMKNQLARGQLSIAPVPRGLPGGRQANTINAGLELIMNSRHLTRSIAQQENHLARSITAVREGAPEGSYDELICYTKQPRVVSPPEFVLEILEQLSDLSAPLSNFEELIDYQQGIQQSFAQFKAMCERQQNSLVQEACCFYLLVQMTCTSCGSKYHRFERKWSIRLSEGRDEPLSEQIKEYFTTRITETVCKCGSKMHQTCSLYTLPKQLLVEVSCSSSVLNRRINIGQEMYFKGVVFAELDATILAQRTQDETLYSNFVRSDDSFFICDEVVELIDELPPYFQVEMASFHLHNE